MGCQPDTEKRMLYDCIYIKFQTGKLIHTTGSQKTVSLPGQWLGGHRGLLPRSPGHAISLGSGYVCVFYTLCILQENGWKHSVNLIQTIT